MNPFRKWLNFSEIKEVRPIVSKVKVDNIINACLDQLSQLTDTDDDSLLREVEREKAQTLCGIIASLQSLPIAYKDLSKIDNVDLLDL